MRLEDQSCCGSRFQPASRKCAWNGLPWSVCLPWFVVMFCLALCPWHIMTSHGQKWRNSFTWMMTSLLQPQHGISHLRIRASEDIYIFFFRSHMSIVGFQGRLKPIVNQFLPRMAIFEKAFLRLTCTALAQKWIKQVQLDWASCSRCSPELRIKAWNRWFDTRRRFGWELPELAMEVSWGFVGKMIKPHWGVSKHPCLTLYLMYSISH